MDERVVLKPKHNDLILFNIDSVMLTNIIPILLYFDDFVRFEFSQIRFIPTVRTAN